MRMDKPTTGPAKAGDIDIEAFSRNVARLIEEGGKALAAYMKPREEGKIKDETVEDITDAVKAIGRVAEYWMSDPRRALELQTTLGRAYLDLWAAAVKRMAGEQTDPVIAPDPRDKRFADPEWSQNQFFDFLKQAYLLTIQWSERLVKDAADVDEHTRKKAEFYVRQIANAISPSNFVFTNPELLREFFLRMPKISCAACTCCRKTSRPDTALSRSVNQIFPRLAWAATWRLLPARSCFRMS